MNMKDLYKISYISNEFDCFFYLNVKSLQLFSALGRPSNCAKIDYGKNLSLRTYAYISNCANNLLSDDHIGVNAVYAEVLGLKEEDEVLISKDYARPLTCVTVAPASETDFELIVKYFNFLEGSILNQVKIATVGQIIPIQVYSNVIVNLKFEYLEPGSYFGELKDCTELVVKYPQESTDDSNSTDESNIIPGIEPGKGYVFFTDGNIQESSEIEMNRNVNGENPERQVYSIGDLFSLFKKWWKADNPRNEIEEEEEDDDDEEEENVVELCFSRNISIYRVNTPLVIENDFPKSVREKCIIAKKLPVPIKVDGPCSFKIFCRLEKSEQNLKDAGFGGRYCNYTHAYIVVSNEFEDETCNDVYCPDFILNILNLRIGCYIKVEAVKRAKEHMNLNRRVFSAKPKKNYNNCEIFTKQMKEIYESAINTVISNIKHKEKANTLIVGGMGTGKSHLLNSVMEYFEDRLLFCRRIDCKKSRKVKIQNLVKLFNTALVDCCTFQPSVLFIDDVDALLIVEEENQYSALYSERIGNLLASYVSDYQKKNDISIVATISSLSKFKSMSTDRGPSMFDNIYEISELDSIERKNILTGLISDKYPESTGSFIDYVTEKTKGYNIQDLFDLLEIAAFKCAARNKSGGCEFEKIDLACALEEKIPLSLYGVNLSKSARTNWNDIGGMEEPKKLLREMFEWPIKYREIYESCPLRLQCGVLLYGAPGTGKTLIASAVASECGLNFISVKGPEVFSKYVGASEQGIRDLFVRAKKAKPCLLFFDEFDSLAPKRGSSNEDVNDRVVNQLLTELDGVEELREVFILAATSRPDLLDPALLRPGRIDKVVHCDLPEKGERLSILQALSKSLHLSDDVDLKDIASRTNGYTGADLQAVLYAAQTALVKEIGKDYSATNCGLLKITKRHLMTGLSSTNPSISEKEKMKYQSIYEHFISSRMRGGNDGSVEALKIMFA